MKLNLRRNQISALIFLFSAILCLNLLGVPRVTHASLGFDKLGGTMVAYGEITEGDYLKFVHEYLTWKSPPSVFAFDSKGGNVIEAMAIGIFVRKSRIPVWISGKCYSACSFIYLAAPTRTATGEIGLHRPYYDKAFYAELSSYNAESEFKLLQTLTGNFLDDIGVDVKIVEAIKSVPSNKMLIYRGTAETSNALKEETPFIEEWKIAKCGSLGETVLAGACAFNWLQHVALNSEKIEGWTDNFMEGQDGEYKRSMMADCQPKMQSAQYIVAKALSNDKLMNEIKAASELMKERAQCVKNAEDSEVWSFYKALKTSKEVQSFFLRPAREIVLEKYGVTSSTYRSENR